MLGSEAASVVYPFHRCDLLPNRLADLALYLEEEDSSYPYLQVNGQNRWERMLLLLEDPWGFQSLRGCLAPFAEAGREQP